MRLTVAPYKLMYGTAAATLTLCLSAGAMADDIDVYTAKIAAQKKPNVLFVLDYSGSMGWDTDGNNAEATGNDSRLDILKNAMHELLDKNHDRINAGIGSLYSTTTSGIRWPISELSADASTVDSSIAAGQFTVSDIIKKQVDEREAEGWTATVDALVEAAQYFRGYEVTHNDEDTDSADRNQPHQWDAAAEQYQGGNANAAIAAAYSPSDAYNSNNSVKYVCNDYSSSGGPNYCSNKRVSNCIVKSKDDDKSKGYERLTNLWGDYQRCEYSRRGAWVGARYNSPVTQACQSNTIVLISDGVPTRINDGDSLRSIVGTSLRGCEDLSRSVFNERRRSEVNGNCGPEVLRSLSGGDLNPDIPGSTVKTYTVGFNIGGEGQEYLRRLAQAGMGEFHLASEPEELTEALNKILDDVLGGSENFAELSIDVDKANFSHSDRAYFSLFTPSIRRAWNGNLKGYFIERTGFEDINGDPATTNTLDGQQFAETAQSFWSSTRDGNDVEKGGASEQLLTGTRNLYTYTGDTISNAGEPLAGVDANKLRSSNSSITQTMMGLPADSPERETALNWIQNAPMGDPLHTKSVTVNYGSKQVAYISTNQGLLHAIDVTKPATKGDGDISGGEELFAFMPKRLLSNLPQLQANTNETGHIYGLDGPITRWHTDTDNDGVVDTGESVLLVIGMRRGGNAYYGLDVSRPESPRLKWVIDSDNTDFPELAQTWSRMSLVNVNYNGSPKKLLAFAAGYDASIQDSADEPTSSKGNAIYMVDENGDLKWTARSDSMPHSIASDLTIIDSDGDKLADRLYVGDVGGKLWRVDFEDVNDNPDITLLADLHDGEHQPFFYPPSVAMNQTTIGSYLSISIGSGNRTDPLLTDNKNYFYMIRDTDLEKGAPATAINTVSASNLYDATNNNIESSNTDTANDAYEQLKEARGWKVALRQGEKALSSLVTFEGKILATTFEPVLENSDSLCGYDTTGRFYSMSVDSARPINPANSAIPDQPLRSQQLNSTSIPSSPVVIFPKNSSSVQVIVDKETVDNFNQSITSVFWHAK